MQIIQILRLVLQNQECLTQSRPSGWLEVWCKIFLATGHVYYGLLATWCGKRFLPAEACETGQGFSHMDESDPAASLQTS